MTLLKGNGVGGTVGTEQQYAEDRWSSLQMHLEATSYWGIAKNTEEGLGSALLELRATLRSSTMLPAPARLTPLNPQKSTFMRSQCLSSFA